MNISLRRGEIFGLIGPNGAGKSTTVNVLSGFQQPDDGEVLIDGKTIRGWSPHRVARSGVARTFQAARLFPALTVFENVAVAAVNAGDGLAASRERAGRILTWIGCAHRADVSCGALNYGDQRRIGIARALALKPNFVLLDEPAAGMNERECEELVALVAAIPERWGCGVLLIEHNMGVVMRTCRRILVLDGGRPIAEGTPGAIQSNRRRPARLSGRQGTRRSQECCENRETAVVQSLVDAAATGSLYALVALAIGLVFGVMRLINFAQADYITIGAYSLIVPSSATVPTLFVGAWPLPLMVAMVALVVVLVALATERLAFRPLRQTDPSTLLVSSFALSFLFQQTVMLIYNSRPKSVNFGGALAAAVDIAGLRVPGVQLLTMAVTLGAATLLVLFLRRTALGVEIRAAAEDFSMAQLLGVRANRVIAVSFAISGLLGALVSLHPRRTDRNARLPHGHHARDLRLLRHRDRRHGKPRRGGGRWIPGRVGEPVAAGVAALGPAAVSRRLPVRIGHSGAALPA